MSCNCEPKKYTLSLGCCEPVLGPIENYYTKYQIDKLLEALNKEISDLKERLDECCPIDDDNT